MKFMKLSSINIVGMSCLLLVASFAQSATMYLCNASPFFLNVVVNFGGKGTSVSTTKHTVEKDTIGTLLSSDVKNKTYDRFETVNQYVPSTVAPVNNSYTLAPDASVSIDIPREVLNKGELILTITATTMPASEPIVQDGKVIGFKPTVEE